jgi:hypothetical protein
LHSLKLSTRNSCPHRIDVMSRHYISHDSAGKIAKQLTGCLNYTHSLAQLLLDGSLLLIDWRIQQQRSELIGSSELSAAWRFSDRVCDRIGYGCPLPQIASHPGFRLPLFRIAFLSLAALPSRGWGWQMRSHPHKCAVS